MQCLLSSLTAVVLLAHALLGCCFHHPHASAPAAKAHGHAGCAGHTHGPPEKPGDDDRRGHECDGGACFFVRAEKSHPPSPAADWELCLVSPASVVETAASIFHSADPAAAQNVAGHVRLHVLHRILLI
jgi:hypothetical protein